MAILAPPLFTNGCMVVSKLRKVSGDGERARYLRDAADVWYVSSSKNLSKSA